MGKSRLLVFSDLDATLLDHSTYSFAAAGPALLELKERGIPLILCTSKTRAETEVHRRALGNTHPFIIENGGAVYVPESYFAFPAPVGRISRGYEVIEFGTPYEKLRRVLGGEEPPQLPAPQRYRPQQPRSRRPGRPRRIHGRAQISHRRTVG